MAIVTSKHRRPLGITRGVVLQPNTPTDVPAWDAIAKNRVVHAWKRAGVLVVEEPQEPQEPNDPAADKDALIAELTALGVKADRRNGIDKLRAMLDEARTSDPISDPDPESPVDPEPEA